MNLDFPIHHVLVVGFHHKKGCQVEYSFPPLENKIEESAWKYLPTLAIPDGAHNYDHDTVYFHLPSLQNPKETVFGVACYQQIGSETLKNKPDDVTRSSVQKSVCVLSKYPLYGHIQVKMQLITAAYFREGDFDQVSILEEAFHNLNACLTPELLKTPEAFVGLSPREFIFTFRHQVLVLFKLLLLEKKILFRGASVGPLCSALLSLISLVPLNLEYGLNQSACIQHTVKQLSIVPQFSNDDAMSEDQLEDDSEDLLVTDSSPKLTSSNSSNNFIASYSVRKARSGGRGANTQEKDQIENNVDLDNTTKHEHDFVEDSVDFHKKNGSTSVSLQSIEGSVTSKVGSEGSESMEDKPQPVDIPDFMTAVQLSAEDAGLPLSLFTRGYLCHPYLSLHYMDLLTDPRVRGFVVGTTNILFKQKKDLVDVAVEMQDSTIDIPDPSLKRLVQPTTQDLRFIENIVRQVTVDNYRRTEGDTFMDGVGWEGGDEWIRAQFKYYLMCLMRTSLTEEGSSSQDSFSLPYLNAWKKTRNWTIWNKYVNSDQRSTPGIYSLLPGHPNDGGVSMSDMKIKFSHTMQNTEGGRRLNQAVLNTSKVVAQTGKAVGGALTTAKGALSSWWNSVSTSSTPNNPLSPTTEESKTDIKET